MASLKYQKPRGTYDITPPDYEKWRKVISVFEQVCLAAGYNRISTPAIESEQLFSRSIGQGTEIVDKELYSFEDKSNNRISLRPEATAPVARAYLENGLVNRPKPLKLYLIEPMFRYDRPQAGRFRQFIQAGVEVFGSSEPIIDAQIIALAARYYRKLGISYSLQINSLGNVATQKKYTKALKDYLDQYKSKLSDTALEQLNSNPLRILDSKDKSLISILKNAPPIIDFLDNESSKKFTQLLEYLDSFGLEYELNSRLVRGLDYYTGSVFEFWGSASSVQNAIGGGGRYDNLIASIGGKPTAAVGFGIGLERVIAELKEKPREFISQPDIYIISIGEEAKEKAISLEQQLLDNDFICRYELSKRNLADQLARASKLKSKYVVIIGKKEIIDQTIILKDMASGNQETIRITKLVEVLNRRAVIVSKINT